MDARWAPTQVMGPHADATVSSCAQSKCHRISRHGRPRLTAPMPRTSWSRSCQRPRSHRRNRRAGTRATQTAEARMRNEPSRAGGARGAHRRPRNVGRSRSRRRLRNHRRNRRAGTRRSTHPIEVKSIDGDEAHGLAKTHREKSEAGRSPRHIAHEASTIRRPTRNKPS